MKKLLVFAIISGMYLSCVSESKNKKNSESNNTQKVVKVNKSAANLNISILLDLSDRIDTVKYNNPSMQFYKRDVGYLKSVAEAFANEISHKKSRHLNDKIQLYFDPEPLNPKINDLSNQLKFHVTRDNGTLNYINDINVILFIMFAFKLPVMSGRRYVIISSKLPLNKILSSLYI